MALNIQYSSQFLNHLEQILEFFDVRNGNDSYSRQLLARFRKQIILLSSMPDIGRQTNHPFIRILFVADYGIEYERINDDIVVIDIYSCQTNPALRKYLRK